MGLAFKGGVVCMVGGWGWTEFKIEISKQAPTFSPEADLRNSKLCLNYQLFCLCSETHSWMRNATFSSQVIKEVFHSIHKMYFLVSHWACRCRAWWQAPVIPAPGKLREQSSSLRPAWVIQDLVSRKTEKYFSFLPRTCFLCHFAQVKCVGKPAPNCLICLDSVSPPTVAVLPTVGGFLSALSDTGQGWWEFLGRTALCCDGFCLPVKSGEVECSSERMVYFLEMDLG